MGEVPDDRGAGRRGVGQHLMLLPTSLVGSYPQPDWLIDRASLAKQMPPRVRAKELWRVDPERLDAAQDDATLLAIRDQERAGLDIVTDGEQRRESYSNRFATALDGVDLDNPGKTPNRTGGFTIVPRVVGTIQRRHPVEVRDVRIPARQHRPHDQDDGAGPVHDGAAVRGPPLPRRGGAGARLCRRGERRDQGPVRGRRRRGAARRALDAGAAGEGQGLWARGARPRARRRHRHHRHPSLLRLCADGEVEAVGLFVPAGARAVAGAADFDRGGAAEARSRRAQGAAVEDHHPRRDRPLGPDGRNAADRRRAHPPRAAARSRRADRHCARLRHEVPAARRRASARCARWSKAPRSCGTNSPDSEYAHHDASKAAVPRRPCRQPAALRAAQGGARQARERRDHGRPAQGDRGPRDRGDHQEAGSGRAQVDHRRRIPPRVLELRFPRASSTASRPISASARSASRACSRSR